MFKNMVLRKIFGSKRNEVAGEWRRLHNEELFGLYCTPTKEECGRGCGTHGK